MFIKVTSEMFADAMGEEFSREAATALFEWLVDLENYVEQREFDPVGIRCEFSEYASATEAARDNGGFLELVEDGEDAEDAALNWLRNSTSVIEFDGGVVIQNF